MAQRERIEVDGSPMQILVDGPADARSRPAVLLLYHREGLDDFTHRVAARLAQAGYRVAAPDISHRVSRDVPMRDRKRFFKDSEVVRDMRATLRWLEARADVLAGRTVALGHNRPRLGCFCGTFRPSRRQIRSTRLRLTAHPAFRSNAVTRR